MDNLSIKRLDTMANEDEKRHITIRLRAAAVGNPGLAALLGEAAETIAALENDVADAYKRGYDEGLHGGYDEGLYNGYYN